MDFVQLWVDSNDTEWQAEFKRYAAINNGDKRDVRYRDWENLKYWFRGIEKFAPWVERVHLVTCGHYPDWLNLNCPKLNFVRHSDFIPSSWLPTFNVNTIELNLHRIKGLAEDFVFFNDDLFLLDKVVPERFFKKGLPCDMAVLNPVETDQLGHIVLNDLEIINKHFCLHTVIRKHWYKWFNFHNRLNNLRTLAILPWNRFTGLQNPHFPNAYKKSVFQEIWEKEGSILEKTCCSRFREIHNVNQYLFRYWQLVSGTFVPVNVLKDSRYFLLEDSNVEAISQFIRKQHKAIICLNDGELSDFEGAKRKINDAFGVILPEKSSFEN